MTLRDVLSLEDALRRLIPDAVDNFRNFRGRNREPEERVITDFDGTFAVEGVEDACVCLLDYDVPRAQLRVYRGADGAIAAVCFDEYANAVGRFFEAPGARSETLSTSHEITQRWTWETWPTEVGGSVAVTCAATSSPDAGWSYHVFVEVPGRTLECLEGTPETSPWRIMLGDADREG